MTPTGALPPSSSAYPEREDGAPCPISPSYEAIRHAAAACALAGGDRPGVLGLIYDADNPYFAGCGDWPGWPVVLREAVAATGDTRGGRFQFTAISWQELAPLLPLGRGHPRVGEGEARAGLSTRGGIRTHTPSRAIDFESISVCHSATRAGARSIVGVSPQVD